VVLKEDYVAAHEADVWISEKPFQTVSRGDAGAAERFLRISV